MGWAESPRAGLFQTANVIRAFGFARSDRLVRYRLVGVAGENCGDPAIFGIAGSLQPCPAVVNFSFDDKFQPQISMLHVIPRTVASLRRISVEHVNVLSKNELRIGSNLVPRPEGESVGTLKKGSTESLDPIRLLGGEGIQEPFPGALEGARQVLQTEVGLPVVVKVESNGLINPNPDMSGRIDDLRLGGLQQSQCAHSARGGCDCIHVEPITD